MNRLVLVILCLTTVFATTASAESPAGNSDASAVANETFLIPEQIAADVLATMDRTADPCQDFYRYACGTWLDNTELPADRPQWLRSFNTIIERNQQVQRELIEKAAADPSGDKASRLVGTYYGACMDEAAVENAGVEPLRPIFAKIDAITDSESLFAVTGELYRQGIGPFYGFGSSRDYKKPDYHVAALVQGGLGLPDMDYYVSDDEKKRELLAEYEKHVAHMFTLLGDTEKAAKQKAASKPQKKAPAKKAAVKKAAPATAADIVFGIIDVAKKGVNTTTLMKKTRFTEKKIANLVYKLKKQGKIKRIQKGVYIKA